MSLGAIILAGGASRRMGADKARVSWDRRRAIDRVCDLAKACGVAQLIVAGPDYGYPYIEDDPEARGPVGGLIGGAVRLRAAGLSRVLALAVDAPTIRPEDLRALLDAPSPGAVFAGLPLPMVADLSALPDDAEHDWPLRRLVERAGLAVLPLPAESAARLRGANSRGEYLRLAGDLPR